MTPLSRSEMADRRVHFRYVAPNGQLVEVVRYDKAGKWVTEVDGQRFNTMSVAAAAKVARHLGNEASAELFLGLPGGAMFDRIYRGEA